MAGKKKKAAKPAAAAPEEKASEEVAAPPAIVEERTIKVRGTDVGGTCMMTQTEYDAYIAKKRKKK